MGLAQLGCYFAYGRLAYGRWALLQLLAQWVQLGCKDFVEKIIKYTRFCIDDASK